MAKDVIDEFEEEEERIKFGRRILDWSRDRTRQLNSIFSRTSARTLVILLIILGILISGIILIRALDSFSFGRTSLDTRIVTMDQDFSLSKGCFAVVEGIVSNTGPIQADNVQTTCTVNSDSRVLHSMNFLIGSIPRDSQRKFTKVINYGCFDGGLMGGIFIDCKSSCLDLSCMPG